MARALLAVILAAAACGGSSSTTADARAAGPDAGPDARAPLFIDKPECNSSPVTPFSGRPLIISSIAIGAQSDGFDLDHDGIKDNKLAGLGPLARSSIADAFARRDLVVPFEIFDLPTVAADPCVKLAFYVGRVKLDRDGDGKLTGIAGGDCNDNDPNIHPGAAEVPGNGRDDNCNGVADEGGAPDTLDRDHDGRTVADGDCDDTLASVGGVGAVEICGDGLDNDCNGVADDGPACDPYDATTPDRIYVDPVSIGAGKPKVLFRAGQVVSSGGALQLQAGPSLFAVSIPITSGLDLDLRITGTQVVGDLVAGAGGVSLMRGRIGGVLDAATLDQIRGLSVDILGLSPEDSLLDVIFGPVLGTALALPRGANGCFTPDIDVDGDGLEAFCDTDPNDGKSKIDLCIDGDGTQVRDAPGVQCTEAKKPDGSLRFVDGISVALTFDAVPAHDLALAP